MKLSQIELQGQQKSQSDDQGNNISYNNPVKESQELARLTSRMKRLKQ